MLYSKQYRIQQNSGAIKRMDLQACCLYRLSTAALITIAALLISVPAIAGHLKSSSLFSFHQQLANDGNANSMYLLANMYERGKVVHRDYKKAIRWYEKASRHGNRLAGIKGRKLQKKVIQEKFLPKKNKPSQLANTIKKIDKKLAIKKSKDFLKLKQKLDIEKAHAKNKQNNINIDTTQKKPEPTITKATPQVKQQPILKQQAKTHRPLGLTQPKKKAVFVDRQKNNPLARLKPRTRSLTLKPNPSANKQNNITTPESKQKLKTETQALTRPIVSPMTTSKIKAPEDKKEITKQVIEPENQFSADPCVGPKARFMSMCR